MSSFFKSIFISLFPILAFYFVFEAILHIINQGLSYYYIGRLIVSSTIIIFFLLLFIKPVARTNAYLTSYTLSISIGFLISILSNTFIEKDINRSLPSIVLFLGWILYLKWYSVFNNRKDNTILRIGNTLPDFEALDSNNTKINSSQFKGSFSIFLFYRGNWCPLCVTQIKEIASMYAQLEERQINTVLISSQPHKHTKTLAKKFNVHFNYLIDKNNKIAKKLHILSKHGLPIGLQALGYKTDTAMPTVIITNKEGKIIFVDLTDNYRVRPEPKLFLDIIDQYNLLQK